MTRDALASIAALHSADMAAIGRGLTCTSCGTREYAAVKWPCATRKLADEGLAGDGLRAALTTVERALRNTYGDINDAWAAWAVVRAALNFVANPDRPIPPVGMHNSQADAILAALAKEPTDD